MKKRLALPFVLFFAILIALAFVGGPTPGKAAGADAPLAALTPGSVYVNQHNNGYEWFNWKIVMPLTNSTRWTVLGKDASFKGYLYVNAGVIGIPTPTSTPTPADVECYSVRNSDDVIVSTQIPPAQPLVSFKGWYLNCSLPSIKTLAGERGYPHEIHDYEDFRDNNGDSNVNLQMNFRAKGSSGTIFDHPSMELSQPSSGKYKAQIYDDLGRTPVPANNKIQYSATTHSSEEILGILGSPPMIDFELAPREVHWDPYSINTQPINRPGQNFAWCMNAVTFTIGENYKQGSEGGLVGDLTIDPRTSQSTGGTTATPTGPRGGGTGGGIGSGIDGGIDVGIGGLTLKPRTNQSIGGSTATPRDPIGSIVIIGVATPNPTDCNPVTQIFTSSASEDGQVLESSQDSDTGGALNNVATIFQLGDDMAKKQYRGILSFQTNSLPDNAIVTSVILQVKKQNITGGGNPVSMFQGFMVDVKKGTFGAAALQNSDFQTTFTEITGRTVGPLSPSLMNGWYNLNLTPAKTYINKSIESGGRTQIRLRLKLDDNNNLIANYFSLFSGNAVVAADRPQLVITYYVP